MDFKNFSFSVEPPGSTGQGALTAPVDQWGLMFFAPHSEDGAGAVGADDDLAGLEALALRVLDEIRQRKALVAEARLYGTVEVDRAGCLWRIPRSRANPEGMTDEEVRANAVGVKEPASDASREG